MVNHKMTNVYHPKPTEDKYLLPKCPVLAKQQMHITQNTCDIPLLVILNVLVPEVCGINLTSIQ